MVTLVVEGDLAACRAAVDVGIAAASRTGKVVGHKVIGRPDSDTEWLVTGSAAYRLRSNRSSGTGGCTCCRAGFRTCG